MYAPSIRRVVVFSLLGFLVLVSGGFAVLRGMIVSGLDQAVAKAQIAHPQAGDDAASLMEYAVTDTHPLRDRNSAVWALGQLRDDRALPVLRQFYTGAECDHGTGLCQYELKKAIHMCEEDVPDVLLVCKR